MSYWKFSCTTRLDFLGGEFHTYGFSEIPDSENYSKLKIDAIKNQIPFNHLFNAENSFVELDNGQTPGENVLLIVVLFVPEVSKNIIKFYFQGLIAETLNRS